jgi:hypothetical protein
LCKLDFVLLLAGGGEAISYVHVWQPSLDAHGRHFWSPQDASRQWQIGRFLSPAGGSGHECDRSTATGKGVRVNNSSAESYIQIKPFTLGLSPSVRATCSMGVSVWAASVSSRMMARAVTERQRDTWLNAGLHANAAYSRIDPDHRKSPFARISSSSSDDRV